MENEMTYGNIEAFFSEMLNTDTPRVKKYRAYSCYLKGKESLAEENFYLSVYRNTPGDTYTPAIMANDYAVIEHEHINPDNQATYDYYVCLGTGDKPEAISVAYPSMDEAALAGLCYIYNGNDNPLPWIKKLMNMA